MSGEAKPSHLDTEGRARMVDVGDKPVTKRVAVAAGTVSLTPEALGKLLDPAHKKGDALAAARLAGIMGAKRTADLIPLCHPVALNDVAVDLEPDHAHGEIRITATARAEGKTGVEMEALTAVSVAALTLYDMGKAVDKAMTIGAIRLLKKEGGRSGLYERKPD